MLAIFTTLLPFLIQLIAAIPSIKASWDAAPKNSFQAVATAVQDSLPPALIAQLTEVGSQLFPKLSPELHAAAAAMLVAHPNSMAWAQSTINLLISTGYISAQPLVVDGIWGPHTKAAIMACQAKMGLPTTGIFADAEFSLLGQLLAKV